MSEKIEFERLDAANQAREDWSEYVCPVDDDRRRATVAFVSDTPEDVLEAIRLEAQDARTEQRQESASVELTADERDRISDLGGFEGRPTTFSWASAKGVFGREGVLDKFHDAMGALTDYDDPAEGAEEWIQNRREADATKGTGGASGGARDAGDVDQQRQRKAGAAAAKARGEGCQQAHDYCTGGDEDACKHLREVCGYDEEEVKQILAARDDRDEGGSDQRELVVVGGGGEFSEMEVTPQEAGALTKSWQGYKAAISNLADAVETVQESAVDARQALAAINAIRENNGQEEMHGDRLHDLLAALDGLPEEIPEVRTLAHFSEQGATTSEPPSLDKFDTPEKVVDGPRSADLGSPDRLHWFVEHPEKGERHGPFFNAPLARQKALDLGDGWEMRRYDPAGRKSETTGDNEVRDWNRLVEQAVRDIQSRHKALRRDRFIEYVEAWADRTGASRETLRHHAKRVAGRTFSDPSTLAVGNIVDLAIRNADDGERVADDRTPPQRTGVIETSNQRTLSGGRDPQTTLAGGETGERGQGEVVDQTEANPGGLQADRREDVGSEPEREQGDLSAVGVSEGLRDADQHDLGAAVENSDDNQSDD